MMPRSAVLEAEIQEDDIGPLDHGEDLGGDGGPVGDPGGQAGHGGFAPVFYVHGLGQGSDVDLGKTDLHEGGEDAHLLGRLEPGAKIVEIVPVGAVGHVGNVVLSGQSKNLGEHALLAEVAPTLEFGSKIGQRHLPGAKQDVPDAQPRGQAPGGFGFRTGCRAGIQTGTRFLEVQPGSRRLF